LSFAAKKSNNQRILAACGCYNKINDELGGNISL